jgi:hypothetical protein
VTFFPSQESRLTTWDLIIALFSHVDEPLHNLPPPAAHLWPSAGGTLGVLHALKGGGHRAFHRGLTRASRPLCPRLPERTRLCRLFKPHQAWTQAFLAAPTGLGVIDTSGLELLHPIRAGRSPQPIGRTGLANHRWIVGGTLCLLWKQYGLVVGWAWATANVAANTFPGLMRQGDGRRIVLSDTGCHAAEGDPANLTLCQRGEWQARLLVETGLARLTVVCHFTKVIHRVWAYCQARLACTMAAFHVLVQGHG